MIRFPDAKVRKNNEITKEATEVIKPAVTLTLVCYEKFERTKLHSFLVVLLNMILL